MLNKELVIQYETAWNKTQRLEKDLEQAKKDFREIAGIVMEELMLENADVFKRLKEM